VDDNHVWSVGPFGHFYCISRKTHQPVWSTKNSKPRNHAGVWRSPR
jgi:hypothetical protein